VRKKSLETRWFSGLADRRVFCLFWLLFFHPDCTVDPGISPDPARVMRSWVITTDRELRREPLTLPRRSVLN